MHDISSQLSHRHFACIEIQQHLKTQKTANKSSSNTGNSNRDDNAATTIEKLIKHVTSMYTLMPLPKLAVSSSCAPYCCIWPLPAATAHRHILYVANADGPTRWTWKPGTPQTKTNNNEQKRKQHTTQQHNLDPTLRPTFSASDVWRNAFIIHCRVHFGEILAECNILSAHDRISMTTAVPNKQLRPQTPQTNKTNTRARIEKFFDRICCNTCVPESKMNGLQFVHCRNIIFPAVD